jgi:hypothetical protein
MSIRYVDAARRTGLQTLPCDPDRIARGFRSNERFFILARSDQFRPVFRVWPRRPANRDLSDPITRSGLPEIKTKPYYKPAARVI